MFVRDNNSRLMPSRDGDVRGDAFNVWTKMYHRDDVDKLELEVVDDDFRFDILTGERDYTTKEEIDSSSTLFLVVLYVFVRHASRQVIISVTINVSASFSACGGRISQKPISVTSDSAAQNPTAAMTTVTRMSSVPMNS